MQKNDIFAKFDSKNPPQMPVSKLMTKGITDADI